MRRRSTLISGSLIWDVHVGRPAWGRWLLVLRIDASPTVWITRIDRHVLQLEFRVIWYGPSSIPLDFQSIGHAGQSCCSH